MAKNDIRARLLKQRGVKASETVRLTFGEVEVRELDDERMSAIRKQAERAEDDNAIMRLSVAESVYVDGDLLLNKEFMDAAEESDLNQLVKDIFKPGDVIKVFRVLNKLMGFGDEDEVDELKN